MIEDALISRLKGLSTDQRLELIEVVWDSLQPSDAGVTDRERAVLDERIVVEVVNPDAASPWPEARARLRNRVR